MKLQVFNIFLYVGITLFFVYLKVYPMAFYFGIAGLFLLAIHLIQKKPRQQKPTTRVYKYKNSEWDDVIF
jgi:hypothetical protein